MKQLFGGVLIAGGIAGSAFAAWQLLTGGFMDAHPMSGARAFAGVIMFGLVCVSAGLLLILSTMKRFQR